METNTKLLERPLAVHVGAAALIILPLLDAVWSIKTGTHMFDYWSWGLILGAGISLLIRHKSAWILGMTLCVVFLVLNITYLIRDIDVEDPFISKMRLFDCFIVLFIVSTVSYFFRYPYLDRRQSWFKPTGERFSVGAAVVLGGVETQTIDLSYTGARIKIKTGHQYSIGDVIDLQVSDINDIQCKAKILDIKEDHIRVHFEEIMLADQDLIRQWLVTRDLQKV